MITSHRTESGGYALTSGDGIIVLLTRAEANAFYELMTEDMVRERQAREAEEQDA